MNKIPERLKVRVGDKFQYGKGKGIVEVLNVGPFGAVCFIERAKCMMWDTWQQQVRFLLESGEYKRVVQGGKTLDANK